MKKFFKDFKDFIQRGNVLDLAVGIIIGGAFGKIVSSLVNDVLMPFIGWVFKFNLQEGIWILKEAVFNSGGEIVEAAVTINYGSFIQAIIDFLTIAFTIFVIIRIVSRLSAKAQALKAKYEEDPVEEVEEVVEPAPTTEELLSEIRDLIKGKKTE